MAEIGSTTVRDIFCRDIFIVGLMYLGRLFRVYQKYIPITPFVAIASFGLLLLARWGGVRVEIAASQFPPLMIFYAVSGVGFLFVYELAVHLERTERVSEVLMEIGNATLTIMALHFLAFKAVGLAEVLIYNLDIEHLSDFPVIRERIRLWWLPYTVVGIGIPMSYVYAKRGFVSRLCSNRINSKYIKWIF